MTDAEQRLWRELRLCGLGSKFRRQHPVGKYIVDFAAVQARLCIEVDGAQHAEQTESDNERTAFLESQGYRLLRFTDREVLTAIGPVKEAIWNALHQTEPPPP
jgi:very-short-patch-repair endonuclease